jgi:dephospho-CoA kinase
MLIGICGKIGSGKDSLADILLDNFSFEEQIRFSDPLTEFMNGIGLQLNRENYQKVGFYLRSIFGREILVETIIRRIKDKTDKNIVVNGIRYQIEFDAIKILGGIIIGIIADDEIRFKRVNERKRFGKEISREEFQRYEKGETEIHIEELLKNTDYTISNNESLKDLEKNIAKLLEKNDFK